MLAIVEQKVVGSKLVNRTGEVKTEERDGIHVEFAECHVTSRHQSNIK